jgi:hypothetical protein
MTEPFIKKSEKKFYIPEQRRIMWIKNYKKKLIRIYENEPTVNDNRAEKEAIYAEIVNTQRYVNNLNQQY